MAVEIEKQLHARPVVRLVQIPPGIQCITMYAFLGQTENDLVKGALGRTRGSQLGELVGSGLLPLEKDRLSVSRSAQVVPGGALVLEEVGINPGLGPHPAMIPEPKP